MFNGKKKFDSKIRFQRQAFKQRLRQAGSFRRPIRKIPENPWQIFLHKAGLGTIPAQISALAIFLFLIYFIFLPNFFSLKIVQVNNAPPALQNEVQTTVKAFLKQNLLWGQTNLLLLSTKNLSSYLLKRNLGIAKIEKFEKDFPHTLVIYLQLRVEKYLVTTGNQKFTVSEDGMIMKQLDVFASSSEISQLIPFAIQQAVSTKVSEQIFDDNYIKTLNTLNGRLAEITGSQVSSFSAGGLEKPDLEANLDSGYKIMFDAQSDLDDTLKQLSLLLSNLPSKDLKNLSYIDMRIKNRSYVCFQHSPCAVSAATIATSTLKTIK